jgi:hypothetical protein
MLLLDHLWFVFSISTTTLQHSEEPIWWQLSCACASFRVVQDCILCRALHNLSRLDYTPYCFLIFFTSGLSCYMFRPNKYDQITLKSYNFIYFVARFASYTRQFAKSSFSYTKAFVEKLRLWLLFRLPTIHSLTIYLILR